MSLAEDFDAHRAHLLSVGYRLTGRVVDAEDAVQEAWLRLSRTDASQISDLRAWLTTVVGRISLDRLRSAAARRERYVGEWLPEPVVTPLSTAGSQPDPLDALVAAEGARFAALVVLEALTPAQRVAFVLHDGFGVPFPEIAAVLDVEPATARKLASRARQRVQDAPPPVDDAAHAAAVERLLAALRTGDIDAVVQTLHPDARTVGDANGLTATAIRTVRGPERVARFYLGLTAKYGPGSLGHLRLARVNAQLGFVAAFDGAGEFRGSPPRVVALAVQDGLVWGIYDIANPEKFGGISLSDFPPPSALLSPPPTAPGTRHPS